MTLNELSKKTGYSVSTLSKAFNNSAEIPQSTKDKIFQIAKDEGCLHHYAKQRFINKVVAVIIPETTSEAYSRLIKSFDLVAKRENITLCISNSNFSTQTLNSLVDYYANYAKVDGIVVCSSDEISVPINDTPIVLLGVSDTYDCVNLDTEPAFISLLRAHKRLGHKKIAFFGEKLTTERQNSFRKIASELGYTDKNYIEFVNDERFEECGRECVRAMLNSCGNDLPTAIICAYDYIAIGAMRALSELGYSIPEDFSVSGVDDITVSSYIDLTSINLQNEKRCAIAFDIIMKKLKNKYYHASRSVTLPAELVVRNSLAKAKK